MGMKQICTNGLRAGAMAALIALMAGIAGCDDKPEQAAEILEKPFDASKFRWPEFVEMLYQGNLEAAKAQTPDYVFMMLLYIKDINEFFSDPGMNAFHDPQCFAELYEPEMEARLSAFLWSEQIPKVLLEVMSLLLKDTREEDSLKVRYPFIATILGDLRDQIPKGRLDRLMYVTKMRSILRDNAKKDALTLFVGYRCSSKVTQAVYKNAVRFVEMEPLAGSTQQ